ncbi:MAG: hypothetical protein U9N76_03420 [Candidatus Marinimicrobia bacterium]|nr:hypothetical protein [Candidatus Neomarinimicrobiota bacterium]
MEASNHPERKIKHTASIPFIWGMGVFFIFFDIGLELYHQIAFRLYEIPLVDRKKYIKIDRYKLDYLGVQDKINCVYCGYANGLLKYATKITGETEKYWCAIRHQQYEDFEEPEHEKEFIEYGDKVAFEEKFISSDKNTIKKYFKHLLH